ncbi:hypothetical protein [Sphingomonas sp. GC_Shp_5]|uniref:hypothetical protein n=1 Tax=Sphingomonas sp. GC_Shp_5 TaxID=2937379 RepID=UPI00226A9DB3|nr:hypothetical protein [Sphingomonas sp. GC_Shp_5]
MPNLFSLRSKVAMSDDADWSGEARWMDLANMRSLGVRSDQLHCSCHHWAIANVDHLSDAMKVPNVRLGFRCSECGKRPSSSRPNWLERDGTH